MRSGGTAWDESENSHSLTPARRSRQLGESCQPDACQWKLPAWQGAKLKPNPFNDAPGALPRIFIGREAETSAAREAIRRAKLPEEVAPVIYLGPRGMGKTSLLKYLEQQAESDALVLRLEPVDHMTLTERIAEQFEQLRSSSQTLSERAKKQIGNIFEALPKVSFALPNDAGSVELSGRGQADAVPAATVSTLTAMLKALQEAAKIDRRFLLIVLDEMHAADTRSLQELAAFVNGSSFEQRPALLAAAGLPETRSLIERELRTYTSRWKLFDLRFLTRDETAEAIRLPITDAGDDIEEVALSNLIDESAGYPFFIQAYASAAWTHHKSRIITAHDVEATLPEVRSRNEYTLYTRPLSRLSPRELAFVLTMAGIEQSPVRIGDIATVLKTDATVISSVRASLHRKGIVASPNIGWLEFRTPFTARYIRQHQQELDDLAVAKYRERLQRQEPDLGHGR